MNIKQMSKPYFLLLAVLLAWPWAAQAQHQHGTPTQQPPPSQQQSQTSQDDMSGMDMSQHGAEHATDLDLGFASGTAWQAQSSPEYMWMTKRGEWRLMAHGQVSLTFNHQGGPRGAGKLESMNWLMFMEQRKLGRGTLQFRQMFSAEALTSPHPGFPQLFQTGETYKGAALVDHQHPHDVFGELSVRYVLPLTERVTWSVYGAPAGEPALGPVTFMHRLSASELPAAPLGHHLQDSTHISFGVVTTGISVGKVKVEGSVFNGREPNEQRWNFDFAPMDSFSGRVSFAPSKNWAMQYSYGHLRKPEALENGNTNRQTASINYNREIADGNWATTVVWGRNFKSEHGTVQNSYLLESTLNFKRLNYAYTRLELVDRDELFPEGGSPLGGAHDAFRIGAYTFGGVRDVAQNERIQVGIGADLTFYSKPSVLDPIYGEHPVSVRVFVRVRPGKMGH
jgi:hypothetical protein